MSSIYINKENGCVFGGYLDSTNGNEYITGSNMNRNQDFFIREYFLAKKGTIVEFTSKFKQGVNTDLKNAVYIHVYGLDKRWKFAVLNESTISHKDLTVKYEVTEDCYVRFMARGFTDCDHTASISVVNDTIPRLEKFIYAICSMDVSDLPVPLSRIEKLWNCLITGETPDFEPLSRNEKYLTVMLDRYDISNLPAPMSRGEKLLYKIAVGETDLSDVPGYLSRYEELLKYLIENSEISEDDFEYVLYTLNQSMYTLYTTAEKPVKSAILSGNTLVNIENTLFPKTTGWYDNNGANSFYRNAEIISMMNPNTDYLLYVEALPTVSQFLSVSGGLFGAKAVNLTNGKAIAKVTTTDVLPSQATNYFKSSVGGNLTQEEKESIKLMIIKYQDGMENWDISYFEGMQSVKMPVLSTVGKNLFDGNLENGAIISATGVNTPSIDNVRSVGYIKVNPNASIVLSNDLNYSNNIIYEYDSNKDYIGRKTTNPFTTSKNCQYIRFRSDSNQANLDVKYQIEYGRQPTSYEPYKSNILTVNEDVTLRSNGNVYDELDCLTGEVTERISEIVLDGTQSNVGYRSEYSNDDYYCFIYDITKNGYEKAPSSPIGISCPIPFQQNRMFGWETAKEFVLIDGNELVVKLLKSKLNNDNSISSLNTYLASNPITINYPLKTESIKTVDLTTVDQDNQPTQLGTFENVTHVSLVAENLIPEVELEVATHISEELASASPLMDDISTEQQQLNTTIDEQSENVDATMIATTEIFEETL